MAQCQINKIQISDQHIDERNRVKTQRVFFTYLSRRFFRATGHLKIAIACNDLREIIEIVEFYVCDSPSNTKITVNVK